MVLRFLFFCVWLAIGCGLPCLALDPHKMVTQYQHQSWDQQQGLLPGAVLTLTQTRDGYLWVGTFEGLTRFDGREFIQIDQSQFPLKDQFGGVRSLLEDARGTLWIGTNGDGLYSYQNGIWGPRLTTADGLPGNIITSLCQDAAGRLWIGTRMGLCWATIQGQSVTFHTVSAGSETPNDVRGVAIGRDGTIYFSSNNQLYSFHPTQSPTHAILRETFDATINSLLVDSGGKLWIGTLGSGVRVWNQRVESQLTVREGMPDNNLTVLCEDTDHNLWIGSNTKGLIRFSQGKVATFTESDGLSGVSACSAIQDREGSLWVGLYTGGLHQFQNGKFTTYTKTEGLPSDAAWVVFPDQDHSLWVGTNGGLSRMKDGQIRTYIPNTEDPCVRTMLRDHNGTYWVGTRNAGLKTLDPERGTFQTFTTKNGLSGNYIRALCEDPSGTLWVATDHGLDQFQNGRFLPFSPFNELKFSMVLSLDADRTGSIWVGTDGNGVVRISNSEITQYTTRNGLTGDIIFGVYEDRDGTIWVTTNNGICRIQNNRTTAIGSRGGLPKQVYQILEDGTGNFWFSTNQGIFRVSISELNALADTLQSTLTLTSYNRLDGLKTEVGIAPATACQDNQGRLWFPMRKGIVAIDPQQLPTNTNIPPVCIEEVLINGSPVDHLDSQVYRYDQNNFEFHCSILSFQSAEKNLLKCKLEGFDSDWQEIKNRHTAYYTNIPPGTYTFQVIGRNNDGVWNRTGTSIQIQIRPAPWQTSWAYAVYTFVLASTIYLSFRLYTRALEHRNQMLEAKVEARTRDLQEANLKLKELDQLKANFTATLVHDLKSPLTVVNTTLELIKDDEDLNMGPLKPLVEAAERNVQKILNLVNEVLDFYRADSTEKKYKFQVMSPVQFLNDCAESARLTAAPLGITFEKKIPTSLPLLCADFEQLDRVFSNLLSNSIKFTPSGGTICVEVTIIQGKGVETGLTLLAVSITDTGEGIPAEDIPYLFEPYQQAQSNKKRAGVGLGLAIVKRIVAAHGGNISVRSQLGVGSTFTVVLPTSPR